MSFLPDEDQEELCHLIHEWRRDWYCYWSGDFGMPSNPDQDFSFRPDLSVTASGVVTSSGVEPEFLDALSAAHCNEGACEMNHANNDLICQVQQRLKEFAVQLKEQNIYCSSEADYPFMPFMLPMSTQLSPRQLLEGLGAHQQLQDSVSRIDVGQVYDMFKDLTEPILSFLTPIGTNEMDRIIIFS